MQIPFDNRNARSRGGALVIALVLTGIIVVGVASYAIMVSQQNRAVARALAWNSAIPVAESGIEEALSQLYYRGTNAPTNGWTITNNIYYTSRKIGTNGSYYTVNIKPSTNPTVTATGYVLLPNSTTNYISRIVQVKTAKNATAKGGLIARSTITFNGNNTVVDSFDSSDPNYSTNGLYTASKRKDNGLVTSNSKVAGAVTMNNGSVYGEVDTGPGGTIAGSGKVGDMNWMTNNATSGYETGHVNNNANVDFPAIIVPPLGTYYSPSSGTYGGTNYTYLLNNATYYTSSKITMNSGVMAIVGNVELHMDNDLSVGGQIYLYPGATLKLYISGSMSIGGNGIVNGTGKAANLTVYGTSPNAQSWSYSGNADFIGTVYAPNANLTVSGNAATFGSFTVNSAVMNGNGGIHYDENLSTAFRGYIVKTWNEL
jgi:Tfp pilus assembly protein PilX